MTSFTSLLISTCNIEEKTITLSGYEKVPSWGNVATGVATRKDSSPSVKMADGQMRVNTDDDMFFFDPEVTIRRGNRILFGSEYYDVIKVNKSFGGTAVHHLEVTARLVNHD